MASRRREIFTTVRAEGAILPSDLLERIVDADADLGGLDPQSYHLELGDKLTEAISRSWNSISGRWATFRDGLEALPETDPATSLTRERWLLPLFQELGYGRLQPARGLEADGQRYPISHCWGAVPIHLVGARIDLDRRTPGAAGAARVSPHGLVQQFLNRSDEHLWGIVSNGLRLRVLRDNVSLTRQAYVEFDLQAMMEGEVYADFVLLWLLLHRSRLEGVPPESCWLECWSQAAQERGVRALDRLRDGVQRAIEALGCGFLAAPANGRLREKLRAGELDTQDYYRQLLRVVYRLLFLFVAEDRGLLHPPDADATAVERYKRYYSTARLRALAGRRRGTRHGDLWRCIALVCEKLGSPDGCPPLGLPALGSFLFSSEATPDLISAEIDNRHLLEAIRALAFTQDSQILRPIDYRNLGTEELGSIYESLLELHPRLDTDSGTLALATAAGHERKSTGSYYTPAALVSWLLDTALDPVLDEAASTADPERAILNLKICDPACGSGHFLIAAAHRIAKRLAAVRTGEEEPSPAQTRHALRDVIRRCLYGVDINPMAAELCKVALWMESLDPGRPLSFLDHHIKVGNSLLGSTPELMAAGIPDDAFTPLTGDCKEVVQYYKRRNREERRNRERGQHLMADVYREALYRRLREMPHIIAAISEEPDDTVEAVRRQQKRYEDAVGASEYEEVRLLADAWCAAFVWRKHDTDAPGVVEGCPGEWDAITENVYRAIEENPRIVPQWIKDEIRRLARQYQFFHWHIEFPEVFAGEAVVANGSVPPGVGDKS